jgi:hypothetical protein
MIDGFPMLIYTKYYSEEEEVKRQSPALNCL